MSWQQTHGSSGSGGGQQSSQQKSGFGLGALVGGIGVLAVGGAAVAVSNALKKGRTKHCVDGEKGVMTFQCASQIKGTAEPGQLLEFNRSGGFAHFALYLGDGKVMNIQTNLVDGIVEKKAKIVETTLEKVCAGDLVRIRNLDDLAFQKYKVKPKSKAEILKAARQMENEVVPYRVTKTNCEYYVTLWRYGVGFSGQADYFPRAKSNEETSGNASSTVVSKRKSEDIEDKDNETSSPSTSKRMRENATMNCEFFSV